ncbi:MAG TPA: peptidoglycan bridge formation glycyltransferase FemA/FemB family protein [Candidatus Saccharimonadales bacterium]|nr:peptidoglycan bridge formation glycyltransferase FemA/FemB family protein [Candidatus Saccharimonadales bacterium]
MHQGLPDNNWDQALQQKQGSILQSRIWAQFQEELGRSSYWAQDTDWQWQVNLRVSHGLRYLLCSYGPAGEGSGMAVALKSLQAAGRQLNADFVRVEPQRGITPAELRSLGGVKIAEASPEYTRIVDLTKDEAELRADLSASHRNRINGTERRGIEIKLTTDPDDFEEFLRMLHDTAARSKVAFWPDDYFRKLYNLLATGDIARMYMARAEGQPVAAAMFYDWGDTRYYAHAGAYQERNRKLKASVSLVWQALLDAKAAGLQCYDLWGVAPEGDSAHHLAGIAEFKAGFGGQQVSYLGTWDIPLKGGKYRLYTAYRRMRGRT